MTEQRNRKPTVLLAVIVVLGGLVILVVLGTPLLLISIQAAREAAQRERESEAFIAQVKQGLQNYINQHPEVLSGEPPQNSISLEIPVDEHNLKGNAVEAVKHRLAQEVNECGLSHIWDDLEKELQPSIRIETQPSNDQQIEIGSSKLGGVPDLPEGVEWPQCNDVPLSFIAQFKMSDVTKYDLTGELPQAGLLSFFYVGGGTWGLNPKDRGGWQVFFFEDDQPALRRTQAPKDLPEYCQFTACQLECSTELTLPPWESIFVEGLDLSEKETESYIDLLDRTSGGGRFIHRLLGHPNPIQGGMQLQCQLAFHGLYTGLGTDVKDPQRDELEKGAADWQLLLQIDSDEKNTGMMWGDVGRLYFWIRKDDLEKRAFVNVWMVLECY